MPPSTTRVSVCMPTYNGERFIEAQMRSILEQLGPDDEVVVSDDSSSDRTVDIIRQIGDSRVRLFTGNRFRSPIYNMENALRQSRGAFIFLSDQDDIWLKDKVLKMLVALGSFELAACDCRVVDADLKPLHRSYFEWFGARPGFFHTLMRTPYVGNCLAFRRSLLDRALPFPVQLPMHDWWLALLAEAAHSVTLVREPLVLFRRHEHAISSSFSGSQTSLWRKIADRVRLFFLVRSRMRSVEAAQ